MTVADNSLEIGYRHGSRRRTKRETCLITFLVFFILLSVGFFVALLLSIFVFGVRDEKNEICMSEDCTVAAATLIQSLDRSHDPCDDFYAFACGGYITRNPVPDDVLGTDVFEQHSLQILHQLRDLVETTDPKSVPISVVKAQYAYLVCVNTTAHSTTDENGGGAGLDEFVKFLDSFGGWPIAMGSKWTRVPLPNLMSQMERSGFSMELVEIGLSPDMRDTDKYRITLDQPNSANLRTKTIRRPKREEPKQQPPSSSSSETKNGDENGGNGNGNGNGADDDEDDKEIEARSDLIRNIALLLGNNNTKGVNADIDEMIKLEKDLAEISTPRDERRNYTRMYNKLTIKELHNITDNKINWLFIMKELFKNVTEIDETEEIIVAELDYIQKLPGVMANYSRRAITNYIMWETVFSLIDQIDPKISALYYEYINTLDRARQPKPRWKTCLEATNDMFGFSLSRLFVDKFVDSDGKATADTFIKFLQDAYRTNIEKSEWLDKETKRIALHKVDTMKEFIGYPDWILDDDKLNQYYKHLRLTTSHFRNIVNDRNNSTLKFLKDFRKPVDREKWTENPTAVNAFYEGQTNSIWFPAGILKAPFFDMHHPASMNFGAIGSIIGHEIGHGFDDEGGQFDERGVLRQWWTKSSLEVFFHKTQCFVDQYNDYCPEEYQNDHDNDTCLDGVNTLGENIADNSGLKCAYQAYRLWVDKHGEDGRLPGLEEYSPDQIFFLSFAHIWCENNRRDQWKTIYGDDPHSPGRYRVQGALSNFPEFAKAFKCPAGPMNRGEDSCSLW